MAVVHQVVIRIEHDALAEAGPAGREEPGAVAAMEIGTDWLVGRSGSP